MSLVDDVKAEVQKIAEGLHQQFGPEVGVVATQLVTDAKAAVEQLLNDADKAMGSTIVPEVTTPDDANVVKGAE